MCCRLIPISYICVLPLDEEQVERLLPIIINAVNDSPEIVVPHHRAKLGAFWAWIQQQAPQSLPMVGDLAKSSSTQNNESYIILGQKTRDATLQVNFCIHCNVPSSLRLKSQFFVALDFLRKH